ncbi:hypothetical protein ABEG10_38085 (plasmid) [Burkholderia cenocepacia]|uniref:hypothetical protein n=1 Tax=Burkholderia cenocepacia TaxID=95486 RepID=UPI0020A1AB2A|nr:hypothetical protein [Burkholderia cenocepacia]MCO8402802.1 hypothetical protein [Burkholderia cenocepacia]MCO8415041.1 hypothetical protein [Burkholderia cenocepacia]MCO8423063.1 hypothetical protein [Burkholderia cenocepacia]MCO8474788.1 hypothetical protein [Burkholderia cenocepacia]MCO8482032.1 hypothetical protein [Burkholderia cenocepacia]
MTIPYELDLGWRDLAQLRRLLHQSMGKRLVDAGLKHWDGPLKLLLWHYNGLDSKTSYEAHPVRDVYQFVTKVQLSDRSWTDSEFVEGLVSLEFLKWRAKNADGDEWRPLLQSFGAFSDGISVRDLRLWQSDQGLTSPDSMMEWLLYQLSVSTNAWSSR